MTNTAINSSSDVASASDADFQSTLSLEASSDNIFEALTTPEGLSSWWTSATGSGLEGGELKFSFGEAGFLVVRVDKAERSVVRWTPLVCDPLPDWVGTTISFEIEPTDTAETRLHFRHTGLTPQLECFDMCSAGWNQYLPSLVSYVVSGKGNTFGANS